MNDTINVVPFVKKWFFAIIVLLLTSSAFAQDFTVTGKITDENGQPLPGAGIVIKGTSTGTESDFDGNYSITITNDDAILTVSFIGYLTNEVSVNNQTVINIQMDPDAESLDEVVLIGYGSTSKKDLVSAVSSVDSDVLKNQPVARVDQALHGRAAGVQVTSNSGDPGSAATIRVRGTNSINGNNDPLFVIDGFIVGTSFNLNNLNVNDIESLQVLKDATALAIYGTRGASGVILITTKNGKGAASGKPLVSINHYTSVHKLSNKVEVLRGQDYLDYKNEESQFVPGDSGFGETDSSLPLAFPGGTDYPNTDWIDLIEQTGIVHNTDISVSGNSENLNYYLSFNRFDQEGVIKGSGLERNLFRANFGLKLSSKWKTGVSLNISNNRSERNKVNFGNILFRVLPIRPVYNEDGSYNAINPESASPERNPVADVALRQDYEKTTNIIGNAFIEFKPISSLTFKSTFGSELSFVKRNQYLPGELPERLESNLGGAASINQNQFQSLLNENTVTYKNSFGDHKLTVLGGFTLQKDVAENTSMSANGFVNDAVGFDNISLGSDASTYQLNSSYVQRTFSSFLGRIDYSYNSKYSLTFVGRRDGSSVFEEGNKYAFFPSAGASWNVDEEEFLKESKVISKLKLRASYGLVGEQGVRPYNSLATFTGVNTYFNENLVNGVIVGTLPSSNLGWETTKQLDLGVELSFLDGRINVEADYYNKRTEDLLLERKVPGTVGSTQLQNIGEIENKGFEINLNTQNIIKENFSWETSLIISSNKNKVIDLGGAEFIDLRLPSNGLAGAGIRLIPNHSVPSFVGVKYLGTYKTKEEIIADGFEGKAFVGSPRYDDLDNNGVINENDKVVLGDPIPDFYGGFRNVFTYKRLTLDVFFQFSVGNDVFNGANSTAIFGRGDENISPKVVNRWIEGVNETSDIPRAGTSTSIFNPVSDLWIEDGSFLRLKSLSMSYDIPVDKFGMGKFFKRANFYVAGNNLLLFTDFSLGDPEVNNYGGGLEQGVAAGSYPYSTSITTGITLDF